jgi:acyl dehydratase
VVRNGDTFGFYPSCALGKPGIGLIPRMPRPMPVKTDGIGKQWDPVSYEVGAEKVREFATAIGAENPVHHDHDAAKAAGFRDLVAPPMFCVVYSARAMGRAILDPELGINLATMLHGSQEFEWDEPVCDGDVISTTATCREIYERDGKGFYVFETISTNQEGEQTVKGTWTNIVRGV